MKTMFNEIAVAVAAMLFVVMPALADEGQEQSQARTQEQSQEGDAVDAAAQELVGQGAVPQDQAEAFKAQVRQRLRLRDGEGQGRLCAEGDKAQCHARLRKHIRDCDGEGRKSGSIQGTEDSARVAAALMLAAGKSEDMDEAGGLVRAQLGKKWQAQDIEDSARTMSEMREQKRWHKQARQMLKDCVGDESCSPDQARATLKVMKQASGRADLDPRECRREIKLALKEMKQEAKGQGGKSAADRGSGDELRTRLQKRLRLHAQDDDAMAGNGQQKRNRYRHGMDGESRQGGGFGGGQSGGAGAGWGGGSGGGGGGGAHGQGGN